MSRGLLDCYALRGKRFPKALNLAQTPLVWCATRVDDDVIAEACVDVVLQAFLDKPEIQQSAYGVALPLLVLLLAFCCFWILEGSILCLLAFFFCFVLVPYGARALYYS